MTYKTVFSKAARIDLNNAFLYIKRTLGAPDAAKSFMTEIEYKILLLSDPPFMCEMCQGFEELDYRKLVIKNYIAVYLVNEADKRVDIVRVFYGKSNYNKYL